MSADQYVFELQFKGKADGSDYRENQFVIIDGSSMADFSKLKEDLALCMPEPFAVQYIDDEDDVVSIDTEEEFQEFAKIAKKRSSRGMLMRLILNSNLLDHGEVPSPTYANEIPSNWRPMNLDSAGSSRDHERYFNMWKDMIKVELKNELLSELKDLPVAAQTSAANAAVADDAKQGARTEDSKEVDYEEDSDDFMELLYYPHKNSRKTKLMHYQKKLEKKEKLVEAKIDQRLEKLEMKRKKLMDKYNHYKVARKPAVEQKYSMPYIISAIASKESSELSKRVSAAKVFTHVWTIINDGTVPLSTNGVELRHTWSSPGLEPEETAVKLAQLMPGQQVTVAVKFKAPRVPNSSFISYWHFFRLVDGQWQEFGHYVSVTGSTKPPKSTPYEFPSKLAESQKKAKDQKSVSYMEKVNEINAILSMPPSASAAAPKEAHKEEKVQNQESPTNITLKKQMEQLQATLASSEIAAEMAREAARLLAMASASAEGNTASPSHTAPKPSERDKLNNSELEAAAAAVQQLNLVDSESDSDANMETNEDPDRGFVIVDMAVEQAAGGADNQAATITEEESKEENKTVADNKNSKEEAQTQPEPISFPRMDPNVTYPVFPPPPPRTVNPPVYHLAHSAIIPPPNSVFPPIPHHFPVFPPSQTPSSHGIVFPPPVNYSQIPNYPPVPAFPPIPLNTQHLHNPFTPFTACQGEKMYWTPTCTEASQLAEKSTAAPAEKPADAVAQEKDTVTPTENTSASAPSEEVPQPQTQTQPQQSKANTATNNEQNQSSEPVQILPQPLIDGAINVAATAYSTAWNALNNLRPKEGEASEFDPVFENNMAVLVEMGFNNLERNARLLKRFNNDISQVIGVICSTGGGCHNLDID